METFQGVHGTSSAHAQRIQESGFQKGTSGYWKAGVYFFEKKDFGIARALNWAKSPAGMKKNGAQKCEDCLALVAELECENDRYLDFSSETLNTALRKLRADTRSKFSKHPRTYQEQMIKKRCLTFISEIEVGRKNKTQILKAPIPLADPASGMGFCLVVYDEKCIAKPPYEACYG